MFLYRILQGSEELFLVEPLAPQGGRGATSNQLSSRETRPLLDSGVVRGTARDLDDTNDAESEKIYILLFLPLTFIKSSSQYYMTHKISFLES